MKKIVDIIHDIRINGTIEEIYKSLTTKEGLVSWWTTDVKTEAKIGTISEFGFMKHQVVYSMEITMLGPNHVTWKCESGPRDWIGTTIDFDIIDSPNGMLLHFVHGGFKNSGGNYGMYNFSWAGYLTSLKNFIETGIGQPNTT